MLGEVPLSAVDRVFVEFLPGGSWEVFVSCPPCCVAKVALLESEVAVVIVFVVIGSVRISVLFV